MSADGRGPRVTGSLPPGVQPDGPVDFIWKSDGPGRGDRRTVPAPLPQRVTIGVAREGPTTVPPRAAMEVVNGDHDYGDTIDPRGETHIGKTPIV